MTTPEKSDLYEFRPRISFNMNDEKDRTIIAHLESISWGDKSAFVNALFQMLFSGDPEVVATLIAKVNKTVSMRERAKPGRPRKAETRDRLESIKKSVGLASPGSRISPAMLASVDQIAMAAAAEPMVAETAKQDVATVAVSAALDDHPEAEIAPAQVVAQVLPVPAKPVSDTSAGRSEDLSRLASSGLLGGASWS